MAPKKKRGVRTDTSKQTRFKCGIAKRILQIYAESSHKEALESYARRAYRFLVKEGKIRDEATTALLHQNRVLIIYLDAE